MESSGKELKLRIWKAATTLVLTFMNQWPDAEGGSFRCTLSTSTVEDLLCRRTCWVDTIQWHIVLLNFYSNTSRIRQLNVFYYVGAVPMRSCNNASYSALLIAFSKSLSINKLLLSGLYFPF